MISPRLIANRLDEGLTKGENMKLYYHPGSNPCRKVVAVAQTLEIPLDLRQIDFTKDNDPVMKEAASLDPAERVPLLEDQGFVLSESTAIMQYLCSKKSGQTLFPEDARKRAEVVRWQCFSVAHFEQATGVLGYENLFKKLFSGEKADPNEVKEGLEEFRDHAGVLDQYLNGKAYFVANQLSLADFSIGAALMYWEPAGMPLPEFKNLHAWYRKFETLPAWQKTTPKF